MRGDPADRGAGRARAWLPFAGIFLLALGLRALYFHQLRDSLLFGDPFGDGQQYDAWARDIAAGDWLGSEVFYQAPLYPYLLGILYAIAGRDLMLVRVAQALLGGLSCVLVAFAGRRFFRRSVGLWAGLLLALYPPAIFYDGLIQKSSLDLFLVSLVLWLSAETMLRRNLSWIVGLGVALAALTLNRENARVLMPVIATWLLVHPNATPARRRALRAVAFVLAFAATLAPVAWRNHHVGGELLVSTSQLGPNFYIGNHAGARGLYDPLVPGHGDARAERADATQLAEAAVGHALTPGEVSDYWLDRALGDIRAEPGSWLRLMAWKLFLVWNGAELVDSESIGAFARHAPVLKALGLVLGFGILCPLAALGLWATRRDWRRLMVLYAMLAGLALSVTIFYVFARYRYPMVPIVILFAAAGVCALPELVRSVRRGVGLSAWAPGVLLAAIVAIPTNWPLPGYREDEITFFNLGITLAEAGRAEAAVTALQEAVAIKPDFGLAHYELARALSRLGRQEPMAQELALAARYAPSLAQARMDLGVVLLSKGDLTAAAREFRAALQLSPASLSSANHLAWILSTHPEAGQRNGAEAIALAERVCNAPGGERPELLATLAAAYAEGGRFEDAIASARRAEAGARAAGDVALAEALRAHRLSYEASQPLRVAADSTAPGAEEPHAPAR